jgi:hypothetical protein
VSVPFAQEIRALTTPAIAIPVSKERSRWVQSNSYHAMVNQNQNLGL